MLETRVLYVWLTGIMFTLLPLRRRRGQAGDLGDILNSCGGADRGLLGRHRIWGAAVLYLLLTSVLLNTHVLTEPGPDLTELWHAMAVAGVQTLVLLALALICQSEGESSPSKFSGSPLATEAAHQSLQGIPQYLELT